MLRDNKTSFIEFLRREAGFVVSDDGLGAREKENAPKVVVGGRLEYALKHKTQLLTEEAADDIERHLIRDWLRQTGESIHGAFAHLFRDLDSRYLRKKINNPLDIKELVLAAPVRAKRESVCLSSKYPWSVRVFSAAVMSFLLAINIVRLDPGLAGAIARGMDRVYFYPLVLIGNEEPPAGPDKKRVLTRAEKSLFVARNSYRFRAVSGGMAAYMIRPEEVIGRVAGASESTGAKAEEKNEFWEKTKVFIHRMAQKQIEISVEMGKKLENMIK